MEGGDELVRGAIAGEPLALERLLLAHAGPLSARIVRRTPARFRHLLAPEDILQETFAYVFDAIGGFKPDGPDAFYRWLVTIADHRLTDGLRALRAAKRGGGRGVAPRGGRSSVADLVDLVAVSERTPSRSASGREAARSVLVGLSGLRDEYREALSLRYLKGLATPEIAVRMGKTESAVHKLCARGVQALRRALGESSDLLSRA